MKNADLRELLRLFQCRSNFATVDIHRTMGALHVSFRKPASSFGARAGCCAESAGTTCSHGTIFATGGVRPQET